MLESIYIANSGLQSFSKGLSAISDNVTNVNTVGYKATNLLYSDVHYQYTLTASGEDLLYGTRVGSGVAADSSSVLFNQGDLRQTNNDNDAAVSGNGFFVVRKDGEYLYSRNGQFEFNSDGDLVTRDGGYKVMALSAGGQLQPISKNNFLTQPATPTTEISFVGNLSITSTPYSVSNVTVYDTLGAAHQFKVTFTRDATATGSSWVVSVADENNAPVGPGGRVTFQSNASPSPQAHSYTFTYQASGASAQDIVLDFGDPGSLSNVTGYSSTSNVSMSTQNGHAPGSLLTMKFDDKGRLVATFSNQQTATGPQLALAGFDNLQALEQLGGGLFRPQREQRARFGTAGSSGFGSISGGHLENSNVDLSQQFTDMIVIQRGYQASSQVLTAANEMMQQLLESGRK